MYSHVKFLTIHSFHLLKGTFSFSIIQTATKLHIAMIAQNDTTGLNRISPITGNLNFIHRLRSLSQYDYVKIVVTYRGFQLLHSLTDYKFCQYDDYLRKSISFIRCFCLFCIKSVVNDRCFISLSIIGSSNIIYIFVDICV